MTWFDFLGLLEGCLVPLTVFVCFNLAVLFFRQLFQFCGFIADFDKLENYKAENKTLKSLIRGDKDEK